MELIFSSTLTSAANSVTTGTLPTGYKSFLIHVRGRSDRDNNVKAFGSVFFNDDTTQTNYQSVRVFGQNGPSLAALGQDKAPFVAAPSAAGEANFFSGSTITVYSPESATGYKSWVATFGAHSSASTSNSGGRQVYTISGVWRNTAPITVLTFKITNTMADGTDADWEVGSSFEVYGLK